MKLIKETNIIKVWKCENGKFIKGTDSSTVCKYLVVDLRNGGSVALRTDSLVEALSFVPVVTIEEKMIDFLKSAIEEFSQKNLDFNRIYLIDQQVEYWNKWMNKLGKVYFIINEKFHRRQDLANKFAEIYEAL